MARVADVHSPTVREQMRRIALMLEVTVDAPSRAALIETWHGLLKQYSLPAQPCPSCHHRGGDACEDSDASQHRCRSCGHVWAVEH